MSDIDRKRAYVSDLYPYPKWKKKVAKMPDAQVIAIFLHEQNKDHKNKPKEDSDAGDDIPF